MFRFGFNRGHYLKWVVIILMTCIVTHHGSQAAENDQQKSKAALKTNKRWIGNFHEMVERRHIRVLMPYSKTFYFFDGAVPRGLNYDEVKNFEKYLNKKLNTGHLKVHLVVIPTPRDKLISNLVDGLGDIAVGNLTITPRRQELVDFADPMLTGINENVVTRVKSLGLKDVTDLAGKEVVVRQSSSYWQSLERINKSLIASGKPSIKVTPADENLEDEDLIEMVNAGLLPIIIVDSHKALFWATIFDNIQVHPEIQVNSDGHIAWAIRKNNPKLKKVINAFVEKNKKGTLTGNILFNRYLKDGQYIVGAYEKEDMRRFRENIQYFEKYGTKFDFDHLMLTALAYQESRLDQSARSEAGAVGIMQVLPSTAKDKNINVPDIYNVESNVHAGTKYLRFLQDRYFEEDDAINDFNKMLFTFSSYNAGPGKVAKLRKEASSAGFNPNIWFKNVEVIAAKQIGRENVQYVSNIYKYYIGYKLLAHKIIPSDKPSHLKD